MRIRAAALMLSLTLAGCGPAAIAAIGTAASISTAVYTLGHNALLASADIIQATAIACRALPQAKAAELARIGAGIERPDRAATPWYEALCDRLSPTNPNLNASSPAWVAAGLTKVEHP